MLQECVVIAREDIPGNKRLVAYLVPKEAGTQPAIEELRSFLKIHLPDYMLPKQPLLPDALPLAPNGKVLRTALPEPDTERPELQVADVAPRTATEAILAYIWTPILGLARVGINDNYFNLGGASIQSLEVVTKANEAGLPMILEMLFEFQTIAELGIAIDAKMAEKKINAQEEAAHSSQTSVAEIVKSEAPTVDKTKMSNTIIESLGTYLPPKVVTSEEVLAGCVQPIKFPLAKLTGIKSRRMAGETEFSLS